MQTPGAFVLAMALAAGCGGEGDPVALPVSPVSTTLIPPLHDAQVGEWIRLEATGGRDAEVDRIVAATDFEVTVEAVTYLDGQPQPPTTMVWHRNGFGMPAEGVVRAFERDRIEVDGKRYDCWRVAVHSHIGQRLYWISEDIPVHGVLKVAGVQQGQVDELHAATLKESGFKPK